MKATSKATKRISLFLLFVVGFLEMKQKINWLTVGGSVIEVTIFTQTFWGDRESEGERREREIVDKEQQVKYHHHHFYPAPPNQC